MPFELESDLHTYELMLHPEILKKWDNIHAKKRREAETAMSGFNPWNPYPAMQPNYFNANYQPPQQAPVQMRKTNAEWVYVNGIQGARDQIVQPGCSLWMMDNNDPIAYYKAVDQMGQPTLRAFQMTEIPTDGTAQQAAAPQFDTSMFVTREEIAAIDGRLNAMDGKFNKFLQEIGGMSDG